jgi:hypothetical protein
MYKQFPIYFKVDKFQLISNYKVIHNYFMIIIFYFDKLILYL